MQGQDGGWEGCDCSTRLPTFLNQMIEFLLAITHTQTLLDCENLQLRLGAGKEA